MSSRIDRTVPALCLVALLGGLAGAQVPQVRQVRQVRQDIVTGVVIDGRGEPVAGSDVLVLEAAHPGLPEGLEGVIAPSMPRHRRVRADTTGRFSIRLDHGRTATLVADQAERGMSFPLGPIPLGGRAQLVLRPTRVVHGTCRGGAQQALVGLQVRVRVPLPGWSTGSEAFFDIAALTDAEGRYQARVPAGNRCAAASSTKPARRALVRWCRWTDPGSCGRVRMRPVGSRCPGVRVTSRRCAR
jgi:hypothetical protein